MKDRSKPFKPQPLEPSIQESLRRVSRWGTLSLTKQGPTGKATIHESAYDASQKR